MKQTVYEHDFRRAFEQCRPDDFSYEGLGALYDYLDQLGDDIGEEIELDVIAICCDFSEYDSFQDIKAEHDVETLDDLEGHTTVIYVDDLNDWANDSKDPDVETGKIIIMAY